MECLRCTYENPADHKFCGKCGEPLLRVCAACGGENSLDNQFCGLCGADLKEPEVPKLLGERKQVTVVFSDLSGYTTISDKLDTEEVKEIMDCIFAGIIGIAAKYDGNVEKFLGDAAMIVFGLSKTHEDDALRAIKATTEIHAMVAELEPKMRLGADRQLIMHSGIDTGPVVITPADLANLAGATINLASRLADRAEAGEILVGKETYRQAERYFDFATLEPLSVKGKTDLVDAFKVLKPKDKPATVHRLSGLKAQHVGRQLELGELKETVELVQEGCGSIVAVSGAAGTGKSRLISEFRTARDVENIQWHEAYSYSYAQNIPYFLFTDLLSRAWQINEGDPPEEIREKIRSNTQRILGTEESVPYIGGLYSLKYPEIDEIDPEFFKSRLYDGIKGIIKGLSQAGPTILLLEDIHWADPSSIELLRSILTDMRSPVLILCTYRSHFSILGGEQILSLGSAYREIVLNNLSSAETQDMLESLLGTEDIPLELKQFVKASVQGNPFYLEEVINSFSESGTLGRVDGEWELSRSIDEIDIPQTVNGVIAARLDLLDQTTKRVLQEASVIGKSFHPEILRKITECPGQLDDCLRELERRDFVRVGSFEPELEYVFKHALTQEVACDGLLSMDRKEIHEKIGLVMEALYQDRLPEFYEALTFHFKQVGAGDRAVDYLIKSAEKSLEKDAVEEAHQYFKEAFELLSQKSEKTQADKEQLVDLLNRWCYVFLYRGAFRALGDLLEEHEELVLSLGDQARLAQYYFWRGIVGFHREELKEGCAALRQSLQIGEEIADRKIITYATTWLAQSFVDMGLLDDAVAYGERAIEMTNEAPVDDFIFITARGALGFAYQARGDKEDTLRMAAELKEFGRTQSNTRSLMESYWLEGTAYLIDGDLNAATESFERAIEVSQDQWYSKYPRLHICLIKVEQGEFAEAIEPLRDLCAFAGARGAETLEMPARGLLSVALMGTGQLTEGFETLESLRQRWRKRQAMWRYHLSDYILGMFYLEMLGGSRPSLGTILKSLGFLIKNVPGADKKSQSHFQSAIDGCLVTGDKLTLAQSYLGLGRLHQLKGRQVKAQECIGLAIDVFSQCSATIHLRKAQDMLTAVSQTP